MGETFDAEHYVEATANALDLKIEAAWRDGVVFHLAAIARAAGEVADFPLPARSEPAWRYEP